MTPCTPLFMSAPCSPGSFLRPDLSIHLHSPGRECPSLLTVSPSAGPRRIAANSRLEAGMRRASRRPSRPRDHQLFNGAQDSFCILTCPSVRRSPVSKCLSPPRILSMSPTCPSVLCCECTSLPRILSMPQTCPSVLRSPGGECPLILYAS
jgi:hypothetical protein